LLPLSLCVCEGGFGFFWKNKSNNKNPKNYIFLNLRIQIYDDKMGKFRYLEAPLNKDFHLIIILDSAIAKFPAN